jgi:hypothetical protein
VQFLENYVGDEMQFVTEIFEINGRKLIDLQKKILPVTAV